MQNAMNIDRYIHMAEENFSGMAGYSDPNMRNLDMSFEGEYGADASQYYEAEGEQSYATGYSYADATPSVPLHPAVSPNAPAAVHAAAHALSRQGFGAQHMGARFAAPAPHVETVAAKQPSPYQVNVTNTTPNPLTVVLFGLNTYLLTPNFGSSVGVVVTPAQVNVSYLELINQSASQPFETSLIRIQTSNASQLTQILTVTSKDANGQLVQIPIITQSYFSANQFQSTILDVPYPVKIDGNTNLSFPILGNTTATYTFFPAEKVNSSRILGGGSELQQYSAPAVPVAVPMFTARPIGVHRKPKMIPAQRR